MKLPLVPRAKYDRQIAYARFWESRAKECCINEAKALERSLSAERNNRELRQLLLTAKHKLSRFHRERDEHGHFKAS